MGENVLHIYACTNCEAQWDQREIGRTRTCPDCGAVCEFQETRHEEVAEPPQIEMREEK